MRCGLHWNSLRHRDRGLRYIRAVHPPVAKMLADAWDPGIANEVHAYGGKVVARRVEGIGGDWRGNAERTLAWAGDRGWLMDYIEFANEESAGEGNIDEWAKLCREARKFCEELDALRVPTRGVVLNTSCGQPGNNTDDATVYWSHSDAVALARYCAAHGHLIGVHEYYRPVPWQGVPWRRLDRGRDDWGRVDGAWMLRVMQAVWVWRARGIRGRFLVTESGRDAMSGTPGDGAGYRNDPAAPFADYMEWYGRHLTAVPECAGWVDFGFGGTPRWESFDMAEDDAMIDRMTAAMLRLPVGTEGNVGLEQEASAHQAIKLNPGAGLQKAGRQKGYWPTGNEWASPSLSGHACQRFEDPGTGRVFVGEWTGQKVDWHALPKT